MSDAVRPVDESQLGNDRALLERYARSQEPAAFLELSRRYAGMVYATCLRITGNAHDAEELTQDCFFELARRASTVYSSVSSWLHRLATNRALNAVRSRTRRRKHEQDAAAVAVPAEPPGEVSWREIEPLVDLAIEELPEELRTPIVLHYLENRPQSEVAAELGVHQSTVSRRIQEGLGHLRRRLQASGVVMAAAPLAGLLATNMAQPAGPQLLASLGKIALAGAGSAATGKAIGGLGVSSIKLTTWAKAAATAALPVVVQLLAGGWFGLLVAVALLLHLAWRRPKWFLEIQLAFGGEYRYGPFFPFERWTWTTPPADWRKRVLQALLASVLLASVALGSLLAPGPFRLGLAAVMVLYAAIPLTTAVRIWLRARANSGRATADESDFARPAPDTITVVQHVAFSVLATLLVASTGLLYLRMEAMRSSLLVYLIGMSIGALWAYADTIGKIRRYRRCRRAACPSHPEIAASDQSNRPGTLLALLVVFLAFAGLFTLTALLQQFTDVRSSGSLAGATAALALLPLFFLVGTVRLFSRLRGKVPRLLWCVLAAIAILCAALCLGLSIAWLLPRRHTPEQSVSATQPPETALISIPVLLPSGRHDTSGELALEPGLRIHIDYPQPVRWKLFHNGTVVHESEASLLDLPVTEPGEYRLESWRRVRGEDRGLLLWKPLHVRPASSESAVP